MAAIADDGDSGCHREIADAVDEEAVENTIEHDPDLQHIASRLDTDLIIESDREFNIDSLDSLTQDSDTASNSSSLKDNDICDDKGNSKRYLESEEVGKISEKDTKLTSNGNTRKLCEHQDKESSDANKSSLTASAKGSSDSESMGSKKGCSPPRKKNPLRMLKKLTKFDKSSKRPRDYRSEFAAVVVDKLPQVFVVKYLGHRQVTGVSGLHHVRKPVDEMVKAVKSKIDTNSQTEMPLLYLVISPKGLDLREHKSNKVKNSAPLGLMPIDFISYGVQDIKYWRVFTCIVVRELSSRSRVATCHAFLCDSSHNGRKMALALGAAFSVYSKNLKAHGKVHNFQIELRPPDELADAVDAEFEA